MINSEKPNGLFQRRDIQCFSGASDKALVRLLIFYSISLFVLAHENIDARADEYTLGARLKLSKWLQPALIL